MSLFAAQAGPRVFALPPGTDFTRALIAGLDARLAGQPPHAAARVEIWVNTRRAQRALAAGFAEAGARLLPRIRVVTELADDPLGPLDLPPPVSPLRRKLELAQLVGGLIDAAPEIAARTAVFDLADSLGDLLDEMQGEGVDPAALAAIDTGAHAEHWQRSLQFLSLLGSYVAAGGGIEQQGRMRAAAEALAAAWEIAPPAHPVIVAGSTGSRAPTRAFMAAVARLPQAALVLPGFDADLPAAVWQRLGADEAGAADHPQHGFRRLADSLGFDPRDVAPWHPGPPPAAARNALVSLALRPAPVTDQWRAEGKLLAGQLGPATERLTWIEAPDPRSEALAIALLLREAAEAGLRAALISPDRLLARRVTAELDRWGIVPDDSAGRPLALTPPGVLLRLLAGLPGQRLTPEILLVLLKHPLVNSAAGARRDHLRLTARLETKLRGGAPWIVWDDLADWASTKGGDGAPAWIGWLRAALEPLTGGRRPLADHVARHHAAAETLASGPDARAPHALWDEEAGQQARAMLDALAAEADAGGILDPSEYRALVQSLLNARDVPEAAVVAHPGIAIWGSLEARVQSADRIILGGLNEGIWPRLPGADPWLGRTLRRAVGLPSPERQIGLSAHDFQQAMGAADVVIARATRDAEAPTVASRWLMRLENLLLGLGDEGKAALAAAKARGAGWIALASRLDVPAVKLEPAKRPAPRPPAEARPRELSVTQVERLVRDPYDIYAEKVLKLRRLDPPGRKADAMVRGTVTHATLESFIEQTQDGLPADAEALFRQVAREHLAIDAPWPAVRTMWTARLDRAARWFVESEAERRERAAPAAREVKGVRPVEGLPQPFALTARADRIDLAPDGSFAIYDYKAGAAPKGAKLDFYLQLQLEAMIAEIGGFEKLPAGPTAHLEVIGLNERKSSRPDADPQALAAMWADFCRFIGAYLDADLPYVARLRPGQLAYPSDYDHLSRRGEWADGDEPETDW